MSFADSVMVALQHPSWLSWLIYDICFEPLQTFFSYHYENTPIKYIENFTTKNWQIFR